MAMNEEEKKAVLKKLNNNNKIILCPRCGKPLSYMNFGNSTTVFCKIDKDIVGSLRGI